MRDWRLTENPWDTLGRYNAEVARGIVHTDEWRAEMVDLQRQFDEDQRARLIDEGLRRESVPARRRRWWHRWLGGLS